MGKPKKATGGKKPKDLNVKGGASKVTGGLRKAGGTNP
jgi:hypothetical protein